MIGVPPVPAGVGDAEVSDVAKAAPVTTTGEVTEAPMEDTPTPKALNLGAVPPKANGGSVPPESVAVETPKAEGIASPASVSHVAASPTVESHAVAKAEAPEPLPTTVTAPPSTVTAPPAAVPAKPPGISAYLASPPQAPGLEPSSAGDVSPKQKAKANAKRASRR